MKKLCLALLLLFVGVSSLRAESKKLENLKFVDATTLNLGGHTMRTEKSPYFRFDCEPYNFDVKNIIRYSRYSTGLYVTFKTNSSQVWATWENVPRQVSDNMTPIFQLGVDLYIKDKGEWVFCGVGRISTNPEKNKRTKPLIENLHEGEKEFLEYTILKGVMENGEESLVSIDDDDEFEDIAAYFDNLFSEELDTDYDNK